MNTERFNQFVTDLESAFAEIIEKFPSTREHITNVNKFLSEKYSELIGMSDYISVNSDSDEPMESVDVEPLPMGKQVKKKKNNLIFISTMLLTNKKRTTAPEITDDIKGDDKESIIRGLNLLNNAIGGSKKKIIYYSNLQGKLLTTLKKITTSKKFSELLLVINISRSYAYFLIRLHKLISKFTELIYCELPVTFFRNNMNTIWKVCEDNPKIWLPENSRKR